MSLLEGIARGEKAVEEGRVLSLEMVRKLSPDVVVMDIAMPDLNGVDAAHQILARDPKVRIIALSTHADPRYVRAMLDAGASAYVVKASAGEELVRAIQAVVKHRKHLSPEIAATVIDSFLSRTAPPGKPLLGPRQREVLQLVAEGKSSPDIAAALHISTSTVEAHRRNLMKKLGLHSVAELTKYAIREGLTSLDP